MSIDYMLLGSLDGGRPIGPLSSVLARARAKLGVDLEASTIRVATIPLEISLDVGGDQLRCVHVTPRGNPYEPALRALGEAIGAVVFDPQTGFELGAAAPDLPDEADDYEIHLVAMDFGSVGAETDVRAALAAALGTGSAWSVRVTYEPNRVGLHASWPHRAAREELIARVAAAARANGWVPFDPQRNDTIGA